MNLRTGREENPKSRQHIMRNVFEGRGHRPFLPLMLSSDFWNVFHVISYVAWSAIVGSAYRHKGDTHTNHILKVIPRISIPDLIH